MNDTSKTVIAILILGIASIIGMVYVHNSTNNVTLYKNKIEHLKNENFDMKNRILNLQQENYTLTVDHERCMNFIARHQITKDY